MPTNTTINPEHRTNISCKSFVIDTVCGRLDVSINDLCVWPSKKFERDVARESIATNAIADERNNAEVYRMQYEMCEESKAAAKQNLHRSDEIKTLQLKLRDKFVETNELIRKCEEKERTAERCVAGEMKKHKQLNQDIEQISAELNVLKEFRTKFEKAIDDLSSYEEVLDQVVSESNLFRSKQDVLNRCDALRK